MTLRDVAGIVVSHIHPDHHGLSRWVREESGAWIAMHAAEAESLPARLWRDREPGSDQDWLRGHGVPEADAVLMIPDPARIMGVLDMPGPDRFVADGERLPIAGRDVRAVWTPGHTPVICAWVVVRYLRWATVSPSAIRRSRWPPVSSTPAAASCTAVRHSAGPPLHWMRTDA